MKTYKIFNQDIAVVRSTEAVDQIVGWGQKRLRGLVVTPNVDHIVLLEHDLAFQRAYKRALIRLVDGMPLLWMSRWLGKPLPERITGADLLPMVSAAASEKGLKIFLLGAAEGVALQAASRLRAAYPNLAIAGTYSPPLGFELDELECEKILEKVNSAAPDILFLGFGSPKQEIWADQWIEKLDVGPVLCVGAAIDFAAGLIDRAPRPIQAAGLEWFWRLLHNPRRLWRRYLLRGPRILTLFAREMFL